MAERQGETAGGFRLSDFIEQHRSRILAQWERRLLALPVTEGLSGRALRDHIPELLERLAHVVRRVHTGERASLGDLPDRHAVDRLAQGFELGAVTSELAALREVILDVWEQETAKAIPVHEVRQLNRAFDEALARSVERYARARERMLRALDQVSSAALGTVSLDTFLPRLLTGVLENTGAVDSATLLLKEPGDVLRVRAAVGLEEEVAQGFSLRVGEGFAGTIAQRREPLLLRDASTHPLVRSPVIRSSGLHALYGVPLLHGEELIGVAHMGSRTAFDFSEDDKQLFRAMAQRASAIIKQRETQEALRQRQQELDRLLQSERAARAAAEETLAILHTLAASTPLGVAYFDHDLRYVIANEVLAKLHGISAEAHLGRTVGELFPSVAGFVEPMLRKVLATGEPILDFEIEVPCPDVPGETCYRLVSYYPVKRPGGEAIGIGVIAADLTARKRAELERERMIEALERLTREAQERSDFEQKLIGMVSHDLRNPLNAITLAASSLLRREELDARATKVVARVHSASERALRLVRDLLDFTQARLGGGIRVRPVPLDFHELTRQVVEEVQMTWPDREFQVRQEGEGQGQWDSDRVAQVLTNLLSNAVQYSPPGTPITVTTRGDARQVLLEVHNQGAPIPEELRPRLFQPMQRGATELDKAGRSVGLGLYIVKHLVDAHGGRIHVRSSRPEGTVFCVSWPRSASSV